MKPDHEQIAAAHRSRAEAFEARAEQMDALAKQHITSSDPNERALAPARQKAAKEARVKAGQHYAMAAAEENKANSQKADARQKAGEAKAARAKADAAKTDAEKKVASVKTAADRESAGRKTEGEQQAAGQKAAEQKAAREKAVRPPAAGDSNLDLNHVYASVDSIDSAVAVTGGKAYEVGRYSKKNAFILDVDGQKYLYANPEYKGYNKLVQSVSPYDGKVENAEHVASKTIEGRRSQGYVLMGKVDAKINQQHGRQVEAEFNAQGQRKMIHREFNHYAAVPVKETGGVAHKISGNEQRKLANKPPASDATTESGKLSAKDRATVRGNLLQDKPAQDRLEAMKGNRIVTRVDNLKRVSHDAGKAADKADRERQAAKAKEQERQNAQHKPGGGFKV